MNLCFVFCLQVGSTLLLTIATVESMQKPIHYYHSRIEWPLLLPLFFSFYPFLFFIVGAHTKKKKEKKKERKEEKEEI